MSAYFTEKNPETELAAMRRRVEALERKAALPQALLYSLGDRAIEYLFGGPRWAWYTSPVGLDMSGWTWTRDLTSMWGGYIHNNGIQASIGSDGQPSDSSCLMVGAPLGPRWSNWAIDLSISRGPDGGVLHADMGTSYIFHTVDGEPLEEQTNPPADATHWGFDVPRATVDGFSSADMEFFSIWGESGVTAHHDFYAAGTANDLSVTEMGPHIRIVGEDGDMLTRHGFDGDSRAEESALDGTLEAPLTGINMNGGGSGVFWWLRLWVPEKVAASSGYWARIHAIRFVRVVQGDGYPV